MVVVDEFTSWAASGARPTPFKDFYIFSFLDDAIAEVEKEDEVRVVPR